MAEIIKMFLGLDKRIVEIRIFPAMLFFCFVGAQLLSLLSYSFAELFHLKTGEGKNQNL